MKFTLIAAVAALSLAVLAPGALAASDPLAAVKADLSKLQADFASAHDTLMADAQALQSDAQSLGAAAKGDARAQVRAKIKADWEQFKADRAAKKATLQADWQQLHPANVPNGRFAIVPPWYFALMLKDNRFVQTPSQPSVMNAISSGQIGEVAGLTIIQSNNCVNDNPLQPSGTHFTIQLGHMMATTYADQIVEVEAYTPEKRFGDAVKGLQVYDAKVIRPEALAKIVVTKP